MIQVDNETRERAIRAIKAYTADGYTVTEIAELLGLESSAHISNVLTQKRQPGPTLIKAMVKAKWIPKPPPYPYFKIRRDDANAAAQQIINTLGVDFALDLTWALTNTDISHR